MNTHQDLSSQSYWCVLCAHQSPAGQLTLAQVTMAHRLHSYDPFHASDSDDVRFKRPGNVDHIGLKKGNVQPKPLQFPIKGQGVIALRVPAGGTGLRIAVSTRSTTTNSPKSLFLTLGTDTCALTYGPALEGSESIPYAVLQNEAACFFKPAYEDTYWLSVDRPNGCIRFGRTLTSVSMTLGEVQLKKRSLEGTQVWEAPQTFSWLDDVQDITFDFIGGDKVCSVIFPVNTIV